MKHFRILRISNIAHYRSVLDPFKQDPAFGAMSYAEHRLSLDPLSEPAHRRLMELEARRGERAAAVVRYRTLVRTLNEPAVSLARLLKAKQEKEG